MGHPLTTKWDPGQEEVADPRPYDYAGLKAATARASRAQAEAARFQADAGQKYADAEREYRKALALEMVRQHAEAGVAWTACSDLARGEARVADLRAKRDAAKALYESAEQIAWQASADRRSLERLGDWSMRVAPDGEFPQGGGR